MFPATAKRVEFSTANAINRRIQRQIDQNIRYFARHRDEIDRRLSELDEEWTTERVLEANAATLALTGTIFGAFGDRRFLMLPGLVTLFLLQHALQGWCPPLRVIRRLGVRTPDEINREKAALRALRGDFNRIPPPESAIPPVSAEPTSRPFAAG